MTKSPVQLNVLTVNDLMVRWGVDRKRIYEAIDAGRLRAFRVGKRTWRVTLAEVERFENASE